MGPWTGAKPLSVSEFIWKLWDAEGALLLGCVGANEPWRTGGCGVWSIWARAKDGMDGGDIDRAKYGVPGGSNGALFPEAKYEEDWASVTIAAGWFESGG